MGPHAAMSMVIKDPTDFYGLVENIGDELPDTKAGDKLRHIRLTAHQSQLYGAVVKDAASKVKQQKTYPQTDLAEQLKIVARLIAGGLKTPLYLVKMDGFDTHDNQVMEGDHTKGEHAGLLKELNDAVMAFMADLEYQNADDKVMGMTFSEFGRRIISNASLGTDHGAAAPMFVFGNKVAPGILGENPVINSSATYKDNLEMQFDFRQVYSSILEQWFELSIENRNEVLLNNFSTVPVIKSSSTGISSNSERNEVFKVFPNPVQSIASIQFYSEGNPISIDLFDLTGKLLCHIFSGNTETGIQTIRWQTKNLPAGTYILNLKSDKTNQSLQLIKAR